MEEWERWRWKNERPTSPPARRAYASERTFNIERRMGKYEETAEWGVGNSEDGIKKEMA